MKPYKIDTLDLNIIEMLEEDCSLTYNEIAEKTGKTLWTVRDRMVLLRKINKHGTEEIAFTLQL